MSLWGDKMKKLVLSIAIASTLGLSACDDESVKDVQQDVIDSGVVVTPTARVKFDPSAGAAGLSIPNDLIFSGTQDGTLEIPVADPTDGSDPFVALSALDGWSTVNPFVLGIDFPAGTTLDENSVTNPASVRIFETVMGGDVNDTDCTSVTRGLACKVVGELVYTQDFITQKTGDSIAVVPLRPLKAETSYIVVMTNNLQDDNGKAVAGSSTYELVRQDIETLPLGNASQLQLQGMINSFEKAVVAEGVDADTIIYSAAMTTQSTTKVLSTVKSLMAANLAAGGLPPVITVADTGINVATALAGVIPAELNPLYSTANLMAGSITLPYYLGLPTAENPRAPVNDWWRAQCDSGATLAGLAATNPSAIPADALNANDAFCMNFGLRDLSSVAAIDTERNLTKFNPIPQANAMLPLDVQMTTPVISPVTDAVRASFGLPALAEAPENGWPIVMLQHGITSKKEDMLAITGILSTFGFATIAIDHPLHGSRGFDLDPTNPGDEINASTVSATHYMNLASLLTTRDNLRQSTADMLGLRLGLNAVVGADIDASQVHFLGHSLGAITGINLLSLANTPLNPALDPMFAIDSNTLAMPGVMVANFLMESGAFGDVIKASLAGAQNADFQAYLAENPPADASESALVLTYRAFIAQASDTTKAELAATFTQFTFAAQTVTDSGDPVNYVADMAAAQIPTHVIEVVGDGGENLSDQVIPNRVSVAPISGTEAAIALLGLPGVSEGVVPGSGAVRFLNGHHGSILSPSPRAESPDPILSAEATKEMQSQVVGFFFSGGAAITVTNDDIVR